jgi:hypothetical protein
MTRQKTTQRDFVERVKQDALQYTRELLNDNQRLRLALATAENEVGRLRDELASRSEQEERLRETLQHAEEDSQRFSARCCEVEQEISSLANLYVATDRLHGSLDRGEVIVAIQEIVANLIGSEEMALFERVAPSGSLDLAAWLGIDAGRYRRVPLEAGTIGEVARTGERWVRGESPEDGLGAGEESLTACLPLRVEGRVGGVLALFRLLPQKAAIEASDHQLFEVLEAHAGTALYCAALRERVAEGAAVA